MLQQRQGGEIHKLLEFQAQQECSLTSVGLASMVRVTNRCKYLPYVSRELNSIIL